MFCKYCGKAIDPKTMRCRICGREAAPLTGGNGFWDLGKKEDAGDGQASAANTRAIKELQTQVEALRTEFAARPASNKPGPIPMIAGALAALALGFSIFALVRSGKALEPPQEPEPEGMLIEASEDLAGQQEELPPASPTLDGNGEENVSDEAKENTGTYFTPEDPNHFAGPTEQDVTLGIKLSDVWVFSSSYSGSDAGDCVYYWVFVDGKEEDVLARNLDRLTFTPIPVDEEGSKFKEKVMDDGTHQLHISDHIDEGDLRYYAFIAQNEKTGKCWVSAIVALYDKSEGNHTLSDGSTGDADAGNVSDQDDSGNIYDDDGLGD